MGHALKASIKAFSSSGETSNSFLKVSIPPTVGHMDRVTVNSNQCGALSSPLSFFAMFNSTFPFSRVMVICGVCGVW